MAKNKQSIVITQTSISHIIIIGIILIGGAVYFINMQFKSFQDQQKKENESSQSLIAEQEKTLKETQHKLNEERLTQLEADAQREIIYQQQIEILREEIQETKKITKYVTTDTNLLNLSNYEIIFNVPKATKVIIIEEAVDWFHVRVGDQEGWIESIYISDVLSQVVDLPSIIAQWKPMVGYVECEFRYADTQELYLEKSGSGIVMKPSSSSIISIVTNKHVITGKRNNEPYYCRVTLPGNNYTYESEKNWGGFKVLSSDVDGGFIEISNPDDYIVNLASSFPKICSTKPVEGDEIIVLGYPIIGSSESITATRGIISGFEGSYIPHMQGKYYITDAKIDQGNSGGAAILLKDNCLLGIPTFATLGQIESLGRILDISEWLK